MDKKIEETIIYALQDNPGLSDRELTDALRGPRASTTCVNQACRSLELRGLLTRKLRSDGLVGSWPISTNISVKQYSPYKVVKRIDLLPEKKMKQILESFLISQGWHPQVNWSLNHGVDIEAQRGKERWIIEVKGPRPPLLVPINSFVSVLGEILQRMDDQKFKYSVAMPDTIIFYRLWKRLPLLAKKRTGITALFVHPCGFVRESYEE